MARVLFVEEALEYEKMGIAYVSACLKEAGHETQIVQTDKEDADSVISEFQPDFLAYSLCTGEQKRVLRKNLVLKEKYPNTTSIFGGPHATFFPELALEKGVDYVVVGQGEKAVLDIVEGRADGKVVKRPLVEDVNAMPLPDRALFYKYPEIRANPMKNIITQRDCPYSCAYCFNHSWRELHGDEKARMFQRKSVDYVLGEITDIRSRAPLEQVLFLDDNFIAKTPGNSKWINEFCERYTREVGLPFACSLRAELVDETGVKQLRSAGLEMVSFALETSDEEVRRTVLNRPGITNQDIENAISLCHKYGIRIRMQSMIGLPVQNPLENALQTLEFYMRNPVEDPWVSTYQPYPKTRMGDYCLEHGFIGEDVLAYCSESLFDGSKMNLPDRERLERLRHWAYFAIEMKMPRELIKVLIDSPLNEAQEQTLKQLRYQNTARRFYNLKRD